MDSFLHPRWKCSYLMIDSDCISTVLLKVERHRIHTKRCIIFLLHIPPSLLHRKLSCNKDDFSAEKSNQKKSRLFQHLKFSRKPFILSKVLTSKRYSFTSNPSKRNSGALQTCRVARMKNFPQKP